jgi:hypothetical protein
VVQDESRRLAERLLALPGNDAARVSAAYERLYLRPATDHECERALAFVSGYEQELTRQKVAAADRTPRAWQGLCRVLLASNEFIFIE